MNELNKIFWSSFFESKQIIRSKVFPILFVFQIPIFIFLIVESPGNSPASIPLIFISYLNIIQTVSVIFIAANIFSKDRKSSASLSLYTRPFSNPGYVLGKALGIVAVFILTSILFTLLIFFYHFFFNEIPVEYKFYILYPILIFLPSIIFVAGLTAFLTLLLRSEIITITLLICLFALVFPTFGGQFPYLWDITSKNLPMLSTDFIGFGNLPLLFMQRGTFIFAGLGLIFISGLLFRFYRQPQSLPLNVATLIVAIACFTVASMSGHEYLNIKYAGKDLRNRMRILENSIKNQPFLSMRTCGINLKHKKDIIEVKASITIENTSLEPAVSYIFRLNPGLEVVSVENKNQPANFKRDIHILTITPSAPLQPGDIDSLVINYRGKIDENACYIDVDESEHEKNNFSNFLTIDKRYAFITQGYVLLTQENQWYPSPFASVTNSVFSSTRRDFTTFKLTVDTDSSLTAISQGESVKNGPGKFIFTPEQPLTQISLVIGDYVKHSIIVDNIEYATYTKKGHDYITGLEKLSARKIQELIRNRKADQESWTNMEYPFNRLSIIEVPVQYLAYLRDWRIAQEIIQPEQIFMKTLTKSFKKRFEENKRVYNVYNHDGLTDEEIQEKLFLMFLNFQNEKTGRGSVALKKQILKSKGLVGGFLLSQYWFPTFFSDYSISPNYYYFTNSFYSEKYPLFDLAIAYYIKTTQENYSGSIAGYNGNNYPDQEVVVKKLLKKYSIDEISKNPELKKILYFVLYSKASYIFAIIKAQTGLTDNSFDIFLNDYFKSHRYQGISAESFFDTLKTSFGVDIKDHFNNWLYSNSFPKFEIFNGTRTEFIKDNYVSSHFNFTAYNSGDEDGVFSIRVNDENKSFRRTYYLKKNQAKEISFIAEGYSNNLTGVGFTSYLSYNPKYFYYPFKKQKIDNFTVSFEGERIIDFNPNSSSPDTIIVDDTSDNFKIVSQSYEGFIKKLFKPYNEDELDFSSFNTRNISNRWTDYDAEHFYGVNEGSIHSKKSGDGSSKVSWDANLPSEGEYDVFYYTPDIQYLKITSLKVIYAVDDFHFFINSDKGTEEAVLKFVDVKDRWTYLGTYNFSSAKAHVELTDKSKGDLVYADAIKFVRK